MFMIRLSKTVYKIKNKFNRKIWRIIFLSKKQRNKNNKEVREGFTKTTTIIPWNNLSFMNVNSRKDKMRGYNQTCDIMCNPK
jgi:hypothetical protein